MILKLCDFVEYQIDSGIECLEAVKIIRRIRSAAIRELPGYNEAKWGLELLTTF